MHLKEFCCIKLLDNLQSNVTAKSSYGCHIKSLDMTTHGVEFDVYDAGLEVSMT